MPTKWFPSSLLLAALLASLPARAEDSCYTLKSAAGKILYAAGDPPFDLSYPPYSKAYEASRARGERLIIEPGGCFDAEHYAAQQEMARIIAWDRAHQPPPEQSDAVAQPRSRKPPTAETPAVPPPTQDRPSFAYTPIPPQPAPAYPERGSQQPPPYQPLPPAGPPVAAPPPAAPPLHSFVTSDKK